LVSAFASLGLGAAPNPVAPQDTTRAAAQAGQRDVIYRREKFVYPTDNRRDPFVSLLTLEDAGPQFENLDLVGIIFGGSHGSVATLIDRATNKRFRVRRGDSAGNARVVEIRPDAVVFQVSQFGVTRSETLRIRREEEEQE
jgi:Tfp pilus assembly protein PilP